MDLHTLPVSMEPLLPSSKRDELAELTMSVTSRSQGLAEMMPSPVSRGKIASLVQEMNSYYSNLIEGHKTFPREIEQALRSDFSNNETKRANQHLAAAHITVEQRMRERLKQESELRIQSPELISWLHGEFYKSLPEELQVAERQDGTKYRIEAGQFRHFEVSVGRHQPPSSEAVPVFMDRFSQFYGSNRILATNQLVAMAAAHQRLAWIHPFGDGNGRVTRLHSQAWLIRSGVDGGGLWTISRALARQREEYYRYLSGADQGRRNDFDGRGNLSDSGLAAFCLFFMRCMVDQIDFMASLLDLKTLSERMRTHLHVTYPNWSLKERDQIGHILKEALVEGEIDRGTATRVAGVSPATGTKLIRKALDEGLLETPSPKGSLSVVFDSKVLDTYFPKLYQDLPV